MNFTAQFQFDIPGLQIPFVWVHLPKVPRTVTEGNCPCDFVYRVVDEEVSKIHKALGKRHPKPTEKHYVVCTCMGHLIE